MKKKKNKINIQMIPTPSRILNISSITKNESNINNINIINKETINTEISDKNRSKSNNTIKFNKNNIPKKRLNTIDIIDKKIDIIYDWNILLNGKNRGIYYKKSVIRYPRKPNKKIFRKKIFFKIHPPKNSQNSS